jgi:hypothetical protein
MKVYHPLRRIPTPLINTHTRSKQPHQKPVNSRLILQLLDLDVLT